MANSQMTFPDARRFTRWTAVCLLAITVDTWAAASLDGPIASPEAGWPQWRGPRRDGVSQEKGLLPSWPQEGPRLLWKKDGLGQGWSSPILVGDRIYITGDLGEDLIVFALDRAGIVQWQTENGRSWKNPYPGARACCAYSEGRVYNLNAHGRLARRTGDAQTLDRELVAWNTQRNRDASKVTWQFTTADARIKLRPLYPPFGDGRRTTAVAPGGSGGDGDRPVPSGRHGRLMKIVDGFARRCRWDRTRAGGVHSTGSRVDPLRFHASHTTHDAFSRPA